MCVAQREDPASVKRLLNAFSKHAMKLLRTNPAATLTLVLG